MEAGSLKGALQLRAVRVLCPNSACASLQMLQPNLFPWSSLNSSLSSLHYLTVGLFWYPLLFPSLPAADVVVWYSQETLGWKEEGCKPSPPESARPSEGWNQLGDLRIRLGTVCSHPQAVIKCLNTVWNAWIWHYSQRRQKTMNSHLEM